MTIDRINAIYRGSNGDETAKLYRELEAIGQMGVIAVNLFRACKTSERAKLYRRGPGFKTAAYERKDWSVGNLATELAKLAPAPFPWGWAIDDRMREKGDPHHHVIYIELPTGQVSFHVGRRGAGPDFPGEWDRAIGTAPDRICRWCATVLSAATNEETRT